MVVLNVDTSDSLVNGSLGVILDIIQDRNGKVKCLIIKFDSEKNWLGRKMIRRYIYNILYVELYVHKQVISNFIRWICPKFGRIDRHN